MSALMYLGLYISRTKNRLRKKKNGHSTVRFLLFFDHFFLLDFAHEACTHVGHVVTRTHID